MAGARIQTRPCSFTFLAASRFFILYQLLKSLASLWPASHLELLISFVRTFSRCLTISRLQLQNEARCKCRQGLEAQLKLSCICLFYGPPHCSEAHASLVCRTRTWGTKRGHTILCLQNSEWQSWKSYWDHVMQTPHFTAEETGAQG